MGNRQAGGRQGKAGGAGGMMARKKAEEAGGTQEAGRTEARGRQERRQKGGRGDAGKRQGEVGWRRA